MVRWREVSPLAPCRPTLGFVGSATAFASAVVASGSPANAHWSSLNVTRVCPRLQESEECDDAARNRTDRCQSVDDLPERDLRSTRK